MIRITQQKLYYSGHSPSHVASSITSTTRHTTDPLASGLRHSRKNENTAGRWRTLLVKLAGVGAPTIALFFSLKKVADQSRIAIGCANPTPTPKPSSMSHSRRFKSVSVPPLGRLCIESNTVARCAPYTSCRQPSGWLSKECNVWKS